MFANVHDLIVESSYRGKGIGKKLMDVCLAKLPHGTWYAHTTSENYGFYRKCGFEIEEIQVEVNCVYYGRRKAREEGHR